jgi:peptidyl-prolyl cis-trans isomerase SurA
VNARFAWLLASALVLVQSGSADADGRLVDRVVARVDGRPILLSDIRRRVRFYRAALEREPLARRAAALREIYRSAFEQAIESELLAHLARSRSMGVSDAEVDGALAAIAKSQGLDLDSLCAQALAAGWTMAEYRAEVKRQILEQRLVWLDSGSDPAPSDSQAVSAWLARRRAVLLRELRRRSCIERLVRW